MGYESSDISTRVYVHKYYWTVCIEQSSHKHLYISES